MNGPQSGPAFVQKLPGIGMGWIGHSPFFWCLRKRLKVRDCIVELCRFTGGVMNTVNSWMSTSNKGTVDAHGLLSSKKHDSHRRVGR